MFVRSLERARLRKCGNQARLLGELLARRAGGVGFGVTRLREGRRAAVAGQFQNLAFEVITLPLERESVTHTHSMRWLDALPVHVDLAAGHRLGRERP